MKHVINILAILCALCSNSSADTKPNIVLFYIDDWAWNGSPVAMDDAMANSRMPVLDSRSEAEILGLGPDGAPV